MKPSKNNELEIKGREVILVVDENKIKARERKKCNGVNKNELNIKSKGINRNIVGGSKIKAIVK